jgi:predicted permease
MSSLLFAIRSHLRTIFQRGAVDREMREEMALHLERATERLRQRGMSDADARDAARCEFGNVALLQEEGRDARGTRWIESGIADVRFALRHFARTPLTAVTLVLVLALGIGVNSAIFSLLQALTMRPAPGVPADDALVRIRGTKLSRADGRLGSRELSMPEVNALAERRETFTAVAAYARQEVVLDPNDGTDTRSTTAHFVTPNYFATLGIRPAIGVGLPVGSTDDAPGAELAVVIGHALWAQMGADTSIVGRTVRLNGVPVRIVGVGPPNFHGAVLNSGDALLFVPLAARAALMGSTPRALTSPDSAFTDVVARLAPNVTPEQATGVVRVIATEWAPDSLRSGERIAYASDVVALRGLTDVDTSASDAIIPAMLGTAGLLVLLVACTNVSALLVGAAVARRREIAIRLSLGASRSRIVRQLLTETSLVALAGGALGLGLYWSIIRVITWLWLSGDIGIEPDLGTVAYTTAVALGTGIVFGLSPALHATRLDVSSALKSMGGGTARSRLQRTFIVAQIVLTQPLLVGIALIVWVVMSENGGNSPDDALAARIIKVEFGMEGGGAGTRQAKAARIADLMTRVAALPGVEAVVPQASAFDIADFRVHPADRGTGSRAEEIVSARVEGAPPGYFAFQNIPVLRGRELVASDTAARDTPVVIDAGFARGFWGLADPIGKRLQVTSRRSKQDARTAVVVGVFDTAQVPLRGAGLVYTAAGAEWRKDTYLVRTRGAGAALVPAVRRLARTSIPDIPIYQNGIATLEQLSRIARREVLQISSGAAAGGLAALLLASIGLYGVVALAVRQRHREIGVRIALGARPAQVIGMFFTSGVRLSVVGLVLGLPLSLVALHTVAASVAGGVSVGARLPNVLVMAGVAIAGVVIAVASIASWIPARRAARVDPLVAIRVE